MEDDKTTTLVLAGDTGLLVYPETYHEFLEKCVEQFNRVIVVFGNHEFYHGVINREYPKLNDIKGLVVLKHDMIYRDGDVSFIGDTLWTNFLNDPIQEITCCNGMNDFYLIEELTDIKGFKTLERITPETIKRLNLIQKNSILSNIKKEKECGQKVVVVTHHSPSLKSRDKSYNFDVVGAYVNELDLEIQDLKPELWIHGHIHVANDYIIGNTRVICNPCGYIGQETKYNKKLFIEL